MCQLLHKPATTRSGPGATNAANTGAFGDLLSTAVPFLPVGSLQLNQLLGGEGVSALAGCVVSESVLYLQHPPKFQVGLASLCHSSCYNRWDDAVCEGVSDVRDGGGDEVLCTWLLCCVMERSVTLGKGRVGVTR